MITFIRHGQATHNINYEPHRKDTLLTSDGIKQVQKLNGRYDLVICSPLKRTRQTLDHSKIIYNSLVFSSICREEKDGHPACYFDGEDIVIESKDELKKRCIAFKEYLMELKKTNNSICVISHHNFILAMTGVRTNNAEAINYKYKDYFN